MAMVDLNAGCVTCLQPSSLNLLNDVQSAPSIQDALRKHFWFTEADLQQAQMCQSCWEQVNNFYRFYISVEELYRSRTSYTIVVKPEPESEGFDGLEDILANTVQLQNVNSTIIVLSGKDCVESIEENDVSANANEDMGADEPLIEPMTKGNGDQEASEYSIDKRKRLKKCLSEDERIRRHVKYICDQCGHESETFYVFKEHALQAHLNQSPFLVCCGKQYRRKNKLLQHVQLLDNPDMFRCKECEKNFHDKQAYRCHRDVMHTSGSGERIFECDQCPRTFAIQNIFRHHMETHAGRWKCEKCYKNLRNGLQLKKHVKRVHPELPLLNCDVCSQKFLLKSLLKEHKKTHEPQQCLMCPQILQDGKSLRAHALKLHPDAMICYTCKQVLPSRAALQAHKVQEHWSRETNDDQQSLSEDSDDSEVLPDSFHGTTLHVQNVELYQDLRVELTDCLKEDQPCKKKYDIDTEQLISLIAVKEEQVIEDQNLQTIQKNKNKIESDCSDDEMEHDQNDSEPTEVQLKIRTTRANPGKRFRFPDAYIRKHVKYICEKCGQESLTFRDFFDHAQEIHGDQAAFLACCGKKFRRKSLLLQHVQTQNNPNMFRCEECKNTFASKQSYWKHTTQVHGSKRFNCDQCRKSFASKYALFRHKEDHVGEKTRKWKCPHCEKPFVTRQTVHRHIKLVHPDSPEFTCDVCFHTFYIESWFLEHKLKHKKLQCLLCPQLFPYGRKLRIHVLNVHPGTELPLVCRICRDVLPSKDALDAHRVQAHQRLQYVETEEERTADIVQKIESKSEVVNFAEGIGEEDLHELEEPPEKQTSQPTEQTVKRPRLTDGFIKQHAKYICQQCGTESITFKRFKDHAYEVHGDQSAAVECCGKKYHRKCLLYDHVRTINKLTIYRCKECNKCFDYKEGYQRHMRRTHVDQIFKCSHCPKGFSAKHSLRRHMTSEHPSESDQKRESENVSQDGTTLNVEGLDREVHRTIKNEHQSNLTDVCKEETPPEWSHEKQNFELYQAQLVSIIVKSEPKVGEVLEESVPECSYDKSIESGQRAKTTNDSDSEHSSTDEEGPDPDKPATPGTLEQQKNDELIKTHVQYKCEHCGEKSESFIDFKRHVRIAHNATAFVSCCGRKFGRKNSLLQHVLHIQNPDVFRCPFCRKNYTTVHQLRRHKKKFHTFKPGTKCDSCHMSFDDEDAYTSHLSDHAVTQDTTRKCEYCSATFTNQIKQDRHIRAVHPHEPKKICDVCCAVFVVKEWYLQHREGHDREDALAGMFKCGMCPESFTDKTQRKLHVQDHIGWELDSWAQQFATQPPYVCTVCSKAFRTQPMFQQHSLKHEKVLQCPDCPKQFNDDKLFLAHVKTSHHQAKLNCKRCKLMFPNHHALQDHKVMEHGAKCLCPFCKKLFDGPRVLNDHVTAEHSGDKPYVCAVCGKGYSFSHNLRKHMISEHQGESPEQAASGSTNE